MAKDIKTKVKLEGEAEFNRQMTAMNNGLKTTRSDMAALSAEFEGNAKSTEALAAKQKLLQSSYDQQKAKVDALNSQYEKAKSLIGENDARTQKYRQQLNFATADLAKAKSALEQNAEALRKAEKESNKYTPITQRMAAAVRQAGDGVKSFASDVADGAHHTPVLGEALDLLKVGLKGVELAAKGAGPALRGIGTVAGATAKGVGSAVGGLAKGVGAVSAASAAGVAAIAAGGVAALTTMASFAKEAAEAAKEIPTWKMTESQKVWAAYADQLDNLDASVANAKSALGGVLLPLLSDLSTEGAAFLNDFSKDMEAAAGDAGKQGEVLSNYIVKGATLIKQKLPEYIKLGKELIGGLGEGLSESGPELLDMGVDLVMDLLDGIIDHAPELAEAGIALVQRLVEGLIERGPELTTSAVDMVTQITLGLAQAAPDLIPAAGQLITQLILALIEASPQLLLAGLELVFGIISGIINGLGDIAGSADEIIEALKTAFNENAPKFLAIGKDIIAGIKEGISNAWDGLVNWFNNLWDSLFSNREVNVNVNKSSSGADGSHASGLDYVPFDGYLAQLHRGEMVLNSFDADRYRRAGKEVGTKIVNLTINAKSLSPAEVEWLVAYINGKLGDDM